MSGVDNNNIPGFLKETIEIDQKITKAKTNITKIQEFQKQILNSTPTTLEDFATKERENLVFNTRNLLVESKDRIKRFQHDNVRIPSSDPSFGSRQQRYEYLKTKLSNVLDEYRKVESDFMVQTKNRITRKYKVVNPSVTQQEINDYVSNSDSQPILQQHDLLRTEEAKNALAEVQKRHEDIKHIENTIVELTNLFQELQLLELQDQIIIENEQNVQQELQEVENNYYCILS